MNWVDLAHRAISERLLLQFPETGQMFGVLHLLALSTSGEPSAVAVRYVTISAVHGTGVWLHEEVQSIDRHRLQDAKAIGKSPIELPPASEAELAKLRKDGFELIA